MSKDTVSREALVSREACICTSDATAAPGMRPTPCDKPHKEFQSEEVRAEVQTSLGKSHLDIRVGIVVKLWW